MPGNRTVKRGNLLFHMGCQQIPQGDSDILTDIYTYMGREAHQVLSTAGVRALRQEVCSAEKRRTAHAWRRWGGYGEAGSRAGHVRTFLVSLKTLVFPLVRWGISEGVHKSDAVWSSFCRGGSDSVLRTCSEAGVEAEKQVGPQKWPVRGWWRCGQRAAVGVVTTGQNLDVLCTQRHYHLLRGWIQGWEKERRLVHHIWPEQLVSGLFIHRCCKRVHQQGGLGDTDVAVGIFYCKQFQHWQGHMWKIDKSISFLL